MKQGGYIRRRHVPIGAKLPERTYSSNINAHSKIRVVGHSEVADTKRNIQALVREIVMIRDGGCILRYVPGHYCSGFANDGHLIYQADHLITRANSSTYADTRLIVCVCKGAHGWKSVGGNLHKKQYDALIRTVLPPDRVALWDACEADSWRPVRTGIYDWKVAEVALHAELAALQTPPLQ